MNPIRHSVWAVLVAALVHAVATLWIQTHDPVPGCIGVFCDFSRHYLPTFRSVLETGQPEARFLYPPLFAVLGAPLGFLPNRLAEIAWGGFQLGSFVALGWLGVRLLGGWAGVGFLALLAFSDAALNHTVWGQVAIPLTALILGALRFHKEHPRTAAALLGLAVAVKYYPAMFLVWWLVRRDWRFVGMTLAAAAAFSLAPVLVMGPAGFVGFLRATTEAIGAMTAFGQIVVVSQGWASVLGRIERYSGLWGLFWFGAAYVVALGIAGALAFFQYVREDKPLQAFAVLFLTIPFLSQIVWAHYLVYLPLVQVVAFRETRSAWGQGVVAASALLSTVAATLAVGPARYVALGLPLLANTLCLTVLALAPLTLPSHATRYPTLDPLRAVRRAA